MYSGVLKLPYPTRRSRAPSRAASRALVARGCDRSGSASQLATGVAASCCTQCRLAQTDAVMRRGWPAWPHPAQTDLPQAQQRRHTKPLGPARKLMPGLRSENSLRRSRRRTAADLCPVIEDSSRLCPTNSVHACKVRALCRAGPCRRHLQRQGRRALTSAAGRSRSLGGWRLRVVER